MAVTADQMLTWCRVLLGADERPHATLEEYLRAVPRLDQLSDLPPGTPVLVRGDVDAKPGKAIGDGDVRLRSMVETLRFGIDRGWKQVVFGHVGRDPKGSLTKVAVRLGELLGCEVPLVAGWLDESTSRITDAASRAIASAAPGSVLMLENTRAYTIERMLWKAKADDLPKLADSLANFANSFAERVARAYVNEALSAGSLDASSTIVPAAMDRVALGRYVASEFDGPMLRCQRAEMVVFSGLKADKLDDLEAMIARGTVRSVISAGSLAMALKKADALLAGRDFGLGLAEDPTQADKPYYIPPARIEQARRMLESGREQGVEFVLPVDFLLADGKRSETIGPGEQQFDIGPQSSEQFANAVDRFLAAQQSRPPKERGAVFYNGVFGKFEDPQFEEGTRRFIPQLKRLTDAGIEVYVGGGEGGAALEKYGQIDWVTHCFTAGGTVLNALGSEPIPYLVALAMTAARGSALTR